MPLGDAPFLGLVGFIHGSIPCPSLKDDSLWYIVSVVHGNAVGHVIVGAR